jgi:hypothetical protein
VLRIGGGPDRPKRDISPEAAAGGRVGGGGKARQGRRRELGNGGRKEGMEWLQKRAADCSRLARTPRRTEASGPGGHHSLR